jgi:hypothetical protein
MHAVSTEETRYYLQGVQVRPRNRGGLILTATDGHILSLRRDPEGAWCSAAQDFIFKPSKSLLAKMKGKHSRFTSENPFIVVEWEKSGGMVTATVIASDNAQDALNLEGDIEHQEIGRFSVEGSFPDAARVLPREMPDGPQALQSFNYELIMRLFHASGASTEEVDHERYRYPHPNWATCDPPSTLCERRRAHQRKID